MFTSLSLQARSQISDPARIYKDEVPPSTYSFLVMNVSRLVHSTELDQTTDKAN